MGQRCKKTESWEMVDHLNKYGQKSTEREKGKERKTIP